MTSEIASEWVERLFFDTKNSTWLPQHGFEQWSTFYLQRRGYTKAQVIDYVALFNAAIKSQIDDPSSTKIPGSIYRHMQTLVLNKSVDDTFMQTIHHKSDVSHEQDALESFAF